MATGEDFGNSGYEPRQDHLNCCNANFDKAAKRRPRGTGSAFHRAGKIHKKGNGDVVISASCKQ